MADLIKKSLVKSTTCSGPRYGDTGYGIHNLQLNYMLENCEDIVARHTRLVECYERASKKGICEEIITE